jgi:hypothetical protein
MVFVKALKNFGTAEGNYKKGSNYYVTSENAKEWIRIGYCAKVSEKKETATSKESANRTTRKK